MKLKFIIDKDYDEALISPKQEEYFEEFYARGMKYLEYSRREYQKAWNEICDNFSDYIERETGYEWFYKTYYCVVSAVHPGISNWGEEPKVVRWWRENAYAQRRITAHEIILSHYFEIILRHYGDRKLANHQIWALAEIAAFALTSLADDVKKFWPWDRSGYYTNHNYPEVIALQKKLKKPFLERTSFDEYIEKGIRLVKADKGIKPF